MCMKLQMFAFNLNIHSYEYSLYIYSCLLFTYHLLTGHVSLSLCIGLAGRALIFSKEFFSQIYVLFVLTSMLYPLCVHRIIKVDSLLYQKFTLWTYSPFRHEVSLLYFSRNNLLRVLTYVCRHCNIKYF